MSLSTASNSINALGIFGRLDPKQEQYFNDLEERYSQFPKEDDAIGIFSHLSLVINKFIPVGDLPRYIDLLRELKPLLPLTINISDVIIKEEKHLALSFAIQQTQKIRDLANKFVPEGVIATDYTKVVWFVPKENQEEAINELKKTKEMIFYDFQLVANRQDDEHLIYSSNRYHM